LLKTWNITCRLSANASYETKPIIVSSNQYTGVIPDILLPDHYDHLKIGERYYNHPLKSDSIKPLKFTDWNYGNIDLERIRELSVERVFRSEGFNRIKEYIEKLKELGTDRTYSLKIEKMLEKQKKIENDQIKIDKKVKYLKNFSILIA